MLVVLIIVLAGMFFGMQRCSAKSSTGAVLPPSLESDVAEDGGVHDDCRVRLRELALRIGACAVCTDGQPALNCNAGGDEPFDFGTRYESAACEEWGLNGGHPVVDRAHRGVGMDDDSTANGRPDISRRPIGRERYSGSSHRFRETAKITRESQESSPQGSACCHRAPGDLAAAILDVSSISMGHRDQLAT